MCTELCESFSFYMNPLYANVCYSIIIGIVCYGVVSVPKMEKFVMRVKFLTRVKFITRVKFLICVVCVKCIAFSVPKMRHF